MSSLFNLQPRMSQDPAASPDTSSLFIPERRFWQPEAAERFLDANGRPRRTPDGSPDYEKLPVPLIDDDYPIVSIPALARAIKSLHVPEYSYPRKYRKQLADGSEDLQIHRDNIDHVQEQYLYSHPETDPRLKAFCYNAERQMVEPWIAHNCKTLFFDSAPVPDEHLAHQHHKGALVSARLLMAAAVLSRSNAIISPLLMSRRSSIETGVAVPDSAIDHHSGVDVLTKDTFELRYKKLERGYQKAREHFADTVPPESLFWRYRDEVLNTHPNNVVRVLGHVATITPWNYSRFFRNNLPSHQVIREHKNALRERTLRAHQKVRQTAS